MDHLVCAEGISNRRPLSGVVSADDLGPFDEPPCLRFSPCRSTVSPPTETWRRPPSPGPWISLGSRMAPPSSLIGGRWGTVCFAFGARFCCFAARGDMLCILVWICVQYRTGWRKAQRSVEQRPGLRQLWLAGIRGSENRCLATPD